MSMNSSVPRAGHRLPAKPLRALKGLRRGVISRDRGVAAAQNVVDQRLHDRGVARIAVAGFTSAAVSGSDLPAPPMRGFEGRASRQPRAAPSPGSRERVEARHMRERKRAHSQSSRPSEQTVPRRPRRRHGDREPPHPGQHGEEMQQRTCDGQVRSSPRAARPRGRLARTQRTEPPHPPSQSPPGRQAPRPAGVCPRAISRAGRPKGSEAARSDASRFTPRSAAAAVSSSQPEPTSRSIPKTAPTASSPSPSNHRTNAGP